MADREQVYRARRERVCTYLRNENIDVAVLEDTEGRRDAGIRYLSGHPGDALLFLFASGKAILAPWDEHLAHALASVDEMIPYNDLGRNPIRAIPEIIRTENVQQNGRCEISAVTPFPLVTGLKEKLSGMEILCRWDGMDAEIRSLRMLKDDEEIAILRKASEITNSILETLEQRFSQEELSETDVALLIERECRKMGAEGTGFETIAAGPKRSYGIHAFPPYSAGAFTQPGLSILDFGIKYQGYTSDVTLTLAKGSLTAAQKRKLSLVHQAYDLAVSMVKPGVSTLSIARAVDTFFSRQGENMPHALGHGIGLQAHEAPFFRNREDSDWPLQPGMVITIEPGLYHPDTGGVRLENDLLITETGHEILTSAKIITLPD